MSLDVSIIALGEAGLGSEYPIEAGDGGSSELGGLGGSIEGILLILPSFNKIFSFFNLIF
jgi:hypothetical protein